MAAIIDIVLILTLWCLILLNFFQMPPVQFFRVPNDLWKAAPTANGDETNDFASILGCFPFSPPRTENQGTLFVKRRPRHRAAWRIRRLTK
jgi:hypothetical protein